MTQPAPKRGPVSPGGPERFGDSAPGIAEVLGTIQQSARGVAEWIDGQATGTGAPPQQAHDHRGGVWGRPLGVGFSTPMRRNPNEGFASDLDAVTFVNVPDVRSPSGARLEDASANGGYSFCDLWIYAAPVAGLYTLFCEASTWADGRWSAPRVHHFRVAHPGGAAWAQAFTLTGSGLELPAGLLRLKFGADAAIADWQWTALVVPHR